MGQLPNPSHASMNPYSTQWIEEDDIQAVSEALSAPLLTQGPLSEEFERQLAEFCHAKFALVFNSATSALYAAYKACIPEGSEAITSPISFVATSNMLLQAGIKPIFCDIKSDGNIDETQIERLITKNTRAIVSVDYAGKSVEVDAIKTLAGKYNLKFISDSSHALGSQYKNQTIGGMADASIFSFHPVKPITTLEGGALLTNDLDIYQKAKLTRSHGIEKMPFWEYDVSSNGFNFRMNEIQAALGLSQLKKLAQFLARREEIAKTYDKLFSDNPFFTPLHPHQKDFSSNHLYPILLSASLQSKKRLLFERCRASGLGVQVHYKPIYSFSYYQSLGYGIKLPSAENFYQAVLAIPCHQKMTPKDAASCAQHLLKICQSID